MFLHSGIKNCFMLNVRKSNYGCTGKFGEYEINARVARGAAERTLASFNKT